MHQLIHASVCLLYPLWLEKLDLTVTHLSFVGGLHAILTDQNKLVVAVGGVTALAAGIYTTRYLKMFQKFNVLICFACMLSAALDTSEKFVSFS